MTRIKPRHAVGPSSARTRLWRTRTAPPGLPLSSWSEDLAVRVRAHLQEKIYGEIPALEPLRLAEKQSASQDSPNGEIAAERWLVELVSGSEALPLRLLLVLPGRTPVRVVVLAQVFHRKPSPIDDLEKVLRTGGRLWRRLGERARELALGRHIHAPPFAQIAERGVGLALFCPAELIPDDPVSSAPVLERLTNGAHANVRGGVLAHWAAAMTAVRELLCADMRFAGVPIVAWGHSRHGKAALLAAAFDPLFAGVIAHQSGRFGASLTHGFAGESPAHIAKTFPHWFCRRFHAETLRLWDLEVDQHHLLALIAPRPILLGNGRRDLWADPAGALRAARAASEAFAASGAPGLVEGDAARPDLRGGIAFFMREGGHGINAADWGHFLSFLEAKFGARPPRVADADLIAPAARADESLIPLASGSPP